MKINIRDDFRSLIPPPAPEELAQLEANIIADGCRDPLVIWNGTLIDGHNRYDICQRRGIKFETVAIEFADDDAAMVWIIRNQFGRRNLAPYTRATLALKLEPLLKAKAKERMVAGKRLNPTQKSAQGETRKELAKAAHVSHDTIAKAKVIEANASPETKALLHSGESSINAEYKKLTVHVGQNSGDNEWYTPKDYAEAARAVMGSIDLDPASSDDANKIIKAISIFTADNDGLGQEWSGRVWMNPPYAAELVGKFINKLAESVESGAVSQAIVLVNNATETKWFARLASVSMVLCFPTGRVKFWHPHKISAPLQGQAVAYIGKHGKKFSAEFLQFGIVAEILR